MREYLKRAMIIKSSRIRFLESWAKNLAAQDAEEVKHADEVFAKARFKVSDATTWKYARQVLRLLDLTKEDESERRRLPDRKFITKRELNN